MRSSSTRGRWAVVTVVSLLLWGVIHVIGGFSLVATDTVAGLETLGADAAQSVPSAPGETTEGLLRFHGLNIAIGGMAVLGLVAVWWRHHGLGPLYGALGIAAALDVGLLAFLVIPGVMPVADGLFGPVLFAIALVGTVAMAHGRVRDEAYAAAA